MSEEKWKRMLVELKPYLNGLELCYLGVVKRHCISDTYSEFEHYVELCKVKSIKTLWVTAQHIFKKYLETEMN